jgi:hypothetical protein
VAEAKRIEGARGPAAPHACGLPQAVGAVNRGEERAGDTDAQAADYIDLDARLRESAQNAGMVRAGGSGSGEDQRRTAAGRIRPLEKIGTGFGGRPTRCGS